MTTQEILNILQSDIHSVVFATLDEHGLPQTCVIDLMLADDDGLYFLTAKGKAFYRRLMAKPFVSLSGMKGGDTHHGNLRERGGTQHREKTVS